jgi:uncharacterized protein
MIDIAYWSLFGVITAGLATLAFRQQKAKIISAWKKEKKEILSWAFVCFILAATAHFLLKLLVNIFSGSLAEKPVNQQILESQTKPSLWSWARMGFALVIFAPVVEELVFRWLLFEALGFGYLSVFLSALTFGLAHYQGEKTPAGILIFLIYPILGLILAYTYNKKKNLIWPVAFHFLNNLVAFLFMLIPTLSK